jgi:glyoxylase-like metal-dependent hydrolase (beta-lactamase superfamily II)/ferredoxin
MASPQRSYPSNAPGTFFVDNTCIDCDLCRQIAPRVYKEESDHSIVHCQPEGEAEIHRAAMALVACPTGSIGTRTKMDIHSAATAFPERIDDNVYFCGYASPNSYGAASYLIVRPEGNVLVDSPRFAKVLVQRIEELGGVSTMFFTHQDDVADHEQFHKHFGCRRIIHRADSQHVDAEQLLDGEDPIQLDSDLLAIPVPGHTRGHVVLLDRSRYLFTGDHLAWSDRRFKGGGLIAFRDVSWYSWPEQTRSMRRLLDYRFEWVLPGHGRRAHLPADVMQRKLKECVEWMSS